MSTEKVQSAIAEVRDQISLDFADGAYLSIVASNLGLTRPRIGFTDDAWRAVVRAIALNHKQTKKKFEEVMAIVFGPKTTVSTALSQDSVIGATSVFVADPTEFPQLGTLILDEGQAAEETVKYCYINRANNEVFLAAPLTLAHTAAGVDGEQALLGVDTVTDTVLLVPDATVFPSLVPYTIVVGAGTAAEEVATVSAVNLAANSLTLAAPLVNTHVTVTPGSVRTGLVQDYEPSTNILVLSVPKQFPESGTLLLHPSGPGVSPTANSFVVSATDGGDPTTKVVTTLFNNPQDPTPLVPHGFVADTQGGNIIQFNDDTTTAALRGVEAVIVSNTGTTLTLGSTLPDTPVATDTYKIRPRVFYSSLNHVTGTAVLSSFILSLTVEKDRILHADTSLGGATEDVIPLLTGGLTVVVGTLGEHRTREVVINGETTNIKEHTAAELTLFPPLTTAPLITDAVQILQDNVVELLEEQEAVDTGQVKSAGTGWDVIQGDPDHVEILIPADLTVQDLRSASYVHTTYDTTPPTSTLSAGATAGDALFKVTDPSDFPIVGVVTLDPGGAGEEIRAYSNPHAHIVDVIGVDTLTTQLLSDTVSVAIDESTIDLTTGNLTPDAHINRRVIIGAAVRRIKSNDANTLVLRAPLDAFPATGTIVQIRIDEVPIGTTILEVSNIRDLPDTGDVVFSPGLAEQETLAISAKDDTLNTITVAATTNVHRVGATIRDVRFLIPNTVVLANTQGGGTTVNLYQPVHAGSSILDGNLHLFDALFPGPYGYSSGVPAANMGVASETLLELLAGETKVSIDAIATQTAIEVENATAFPLTGFPYNIRIGENTGNRETLIVNEINLKQRTSAKVDGIVAVGSSFLTVDDFTDTLPPGPGNGTADSFPDSHSYRVIVDKGESHEEVLYVRGVSELPSRRLLLQDPTTVVHHGLETVELMADVLSVVPTTDAHDGIVSRTNRSSHQAGSTEAAKHPPITTLDFTTAELTAPLYADMLLSDGSDFAENGARTYLNFGNTSQDFDTQLGLASGIGDATLTLILTTPPTPDASLFPSAGPLVVTIEPGRLNEERVLVESRDIGANTITLSSSLRRAHAAGSVVEFKAGNEEVLTYSSVSTNNLSFSSPIVLQ